MGPVERRVRRQFLAVRWHDRIEHCPCSVGKAHGNCGGQKSCWPEAPEWWNWLRAALRLCAAPEELTARRSTPARSANDEQAFTGLATFRCVPEGEQRSWQLALASGAGVQARDCGRCKWPTEADSLCRRAADWNATERTMILCSACGCGARILTEIENRCDESRPRILPPNV